MIRFHRPRAFTIVELLVVIGIIGILVALGLIVAGKVSGSGKQRLTEQTLKILDSALEAYKSAKGGNPPPTVPDPRWNPSLGGSQRIIPIIDGRSYTSPLPPAPEDPYMINSVGLFMLQCKDVPQAEALLKDLDTKIVREYDPDVSDPSANNPNFALQPKLLTAFDGWGNPIRYVHPAFKGVIVFAPGQANPRLVDRILGPAPAGMSYGITEIRRADASLAPATPLDADGGLPKGSAPYFYSAGPDGDPTTTQDNVYITTPTFLK